MPPRTPTVRDLTRRLIAVPSAGNGPPGNAALAVHAACERTYRELTRTIGLGSSETLFLRALAESQAQHPLLAKIRIGRLAKPDIAGVAAMVEAHGAPAVAEALESLLETLLELLGRFIGLDMVAGLVDQIAPPKNAE